MKSLKDKWGLFFDIVLDPWTLLLIGGVIGLFALSFGQTDSTITSLLYVLVTIASAILGGRITKHWFDITEGGVVMARGKPAVRSLKVLLRITAFLERRVAEFGANSDEIKNNPAVTKRNYEEIRGICISLGEQTVNSIENWTDIVPEADISSQIGVLSGLAESLRHQEKELIDVKEELKVSKGNDEDRNGLEAEAVRREEEIASLKKEIRNKNIALSGVSAAGGIGSLIPESTHKSSGLFGESLPFFKVSETVFGYPKDSTSGFSSTEKSAATKLPTRKAKPHKK